MTVCLDLLVVADYTDGGLGLAAIDHARHYALRGWRTALAAPEAADIAGVEGLYCVTKKGPNSLTTGGAGPTQTRSEPNR